MPLEPSEIKKVPVTRHDVNVTLDHIFVPLANAVASLNIEKPTASAAVIAQADTVGQLASQMQQAVAELNQMDPSG